MTVVVHEVAIREKQSFRSEWGKARELLLHRVYNGNLPVEEQVILQRWYEIRANLLMTHDNGTFEVSRGEFDGQLPEKMSGKLVDGIRMISYFMSDEEKIR